MSGVYSKKNTQEEKVFVLFWQHFYKCGITSEEKEEKIVKSSWLTLPLWNGVCKLEERIPVELAIELKTPEQSPPSRALWGHHDFHIMGLAISRVLVTSTASTFDSA